MRGKTIQSILAFVCYVLFYCSYANATIVINTPVTGDYSATASDTYELLSTVSGNFTFNLTSSNASLTIFSGGAISQNLYINKGTVSITLEAGSRVGGSITDNAGNVPTVLSIYGTVDKGIDLNTQGNKTVTISGTFAQVGYLANDTVSIRGTQSSASIYTVTNGAVLNGSISTGNQNDRITVSNSASTGSLLGTGGNKTILVQNSAVINGDINTANGTGTGNNTISIYYSTVTGNITTGSSGNDTLTIVGSLISSAITVGTGVDTLTLEEATNVGGNVTATGSLAITSTFGSSIQGNLAVTQALNLTAPTGIYIKGTTTSGANSTYNVNRSTFVGAVQLQGSTTMVAKDSTFSSDITANSSASLTFNNTKGQNINSQNSNQTTYIALQNNSYFNTITGGSGTTTIESNLSSISTITGNNATITAQDSTIGSINITQRLTLDFLRSTLQTALTNTTSSSTIVINADASNFNGSISLQGQSTINMKNSSIRGNLTTGAQSDSITLFGTTLLDLDSGTGTDTITITNTDLNTVTLQSGQKTFTSTSSLFSLLKLSPTQNTVRLDSSTFHQIISETSPQQANSLYITNKNTLTGPYLAIGGGTVYLEGTLAVARDTRISTGAPVLIQGTTLQIAQGASLFLSAQPQDSTTYVYFKDIINNSDKPVTTLHVNTFNGVKTILDLSHISTYSNRDYLVDIRGVLGRGKPLSRIEGVILSIDSLVPKTEREYVLLNGNLYTLEESPTTSNSYDLVYQGVSPTNYGYAAAHNALRSFNTSVWHNLLSHFQEEATMFRDREGKPRRAGSVVNAVSLWARGGYSMSTINPSFSTPQLNETSITLFAGLDFANISIGESSSLLFQFFAGVGDITSDFKKIPIERISFEGHHTTITGGASLGVQKLTHQGRGKLYAIASLWYSIINNELSSNLFPETNTWNNQSISFSASFGYNIYLQQIIINPQLDLGYFNTFKKTYVSPDMNVITFKEDQRMIGRASLLLGYAFQAGITPYLRGGIELPLFRGKSSGDVVMESSPVPYSYNTTSFTTDVTLGISYRGGYRHFSFTFSTEATILLGAKSGLEVLAQLGFQF